MSLSTAQRGVATGALTALVLSLVTLGALVVVQPLDAAPATGLTRVQVLVLCCLGPVLVLTACIGRLAKHRFQTPADLDGGGLTAGTDRAKVLQALLQNTLEQVVLALPVYAAWAVLAPWPLLAALPGAALLFVCGRLLFFRGYAGGAPRRALGFGLTFYPSVLLLVGSLVAAVAFLLRWT